MHRETIWANFVTQVGTTWGDYVRMLDDNASYLGKLGLRVVDIGQLLSFEFQQADGLGPIGTLSSAVDAAVEAPGLPLVFSRYFAEPISARYKLGPLGRGWSHNWQYSIQQTPDGTVMVIGPGGSLRTFQPDSRHSGTYFSQPGDHATLTALGGGGFTLRETDGLLRAFRPDGKLDYVEDTNGNRIICTYAGDLLTRLDHTSGQWLQIAYNAAERIQSITDSVGRQTTFSYQGEHLTAVQYYDDRVATYSYSLAGASAHALTEVASSCCTRQYFEYDTQGRLYRVHRGGGAEVTTFAYDSAGKVTATDAVGNSSKFYFDHRGLLVKKEDALGNAVYSSFDDQYNLVRLTDPAGRSYTYTYDRQGNLISSVDPLGSATHFTYATPFNRLASLTDANSNVTKYAYDTDGNLNSITYADGSSESWDYDSLGDATSWANRRGHVIGYTYNISGRITRKTYADTSHVDYSYDARGNLIQTVDPMGTTTYTYDANGRLVRIDYPGPGGRWLQFTYDTAGRRASSLDQSGHCLVYHYDAVGRLEFMTNESSTEVVRYSYDAAGRITHKTLGNGVYTTYQYDAAGQLLHLVNYKSDSSILSRFNYTYDSRGRRTSMNTSYGLWTYEYDDLGQLTHAVLASTDPSIPNQDLAYVCDALGNRISTIENGVTTEYTANNMNQYTQVGNTTYVFDADGNLIQEIAPGGTTTYTYSDDNRLIAVTKGADTWQYIYDALGNRAATTENGVTTRYVIDRTGLGNVVGEYDAAGNLIAHYDYGLGLVSRTDATGTPAYYAFDALGSASELVTASGALANSYAYTPFGTLIRGTETLPNVFQYVGQSGVMKEGGGLSYMRARFYDAQTGQFLSKDPIGYALRDPNLYRYASNNPVSQADPRGLLSVESCVRDLCPLFVRVACSAICWALVIEGMPIPYLPLCIRLCERSEKGCQAACDFWLPPEPTPGNPPQPNNPNPPSPPTPPTPPIPVSPVRPVDPNQKAGPTGFGSPGYISPDSLMAYRIDFENESSATAPAQQVTITDQLDSNLDGSTFRLTEIGFGDQLIAVPIETQHFETTLPMTYSGVAFDVQITAGIDPATGKLQANFFSIDPMTSLPPAVNIGFLPPENGTGRGMGHVSYTVRPKAGLPDGTEIRNVALISFDGQPAIATNQVDPHDPSKGNDPTKECLNTISSSIQAGNSTSVSGITREGNGNILPGVSITLDGIGSVVSDQSGQYEIMATATGDYTVTAHKDGFRDRTQIINISGLGQEFAVTCNFQGQYGLIPKAPNMWYALDCVNLWLYPPNLETGLDMWTALDVINAWLYPVQ